MIKLYSSSEHKQVYFNLSQWNGVNVEDLIDYMSHLGYDRLQVIGED